MRAARRRPSLKERKEPKRAVAQDAPRASPLADEMHEFDSKDLKRLFGIPASQVRSLIRAGHIHPLKKAGRLSYSFQDLIVLRTAGSLRAAKIPAQRINRTLREIRESLPGELPLSGLSIVAVGDRIMVREGQALRESDTGQYTLELEVIEQRRRPLGHRPGATRTRETGRGGAATGARSTAPPRRRRDGGREFRGGGREFEKRSSSRTPTPKRHARPTRRVSRPTQRHLEARLNLGQAPAPGRAARRSGEDLSQHASAARRLLSFNLAVLLEDFER